LILASRSRPLRLVLAIALIGALAAGGGLVTFFVGGDPPAPVSILPTASPGGGPTAVPSGPVAAASGEPGTTDAPSGIEGAWAMDTSVGSFTDFSGTWAGFRVDEILGQGIGSTTAVGRTPGVSGELTIDGALLTTTRIEVDLTRIVSDRTRRDDAIQRTLGTGDFPTATFELTAPVELGAEAAAGGVISTIASGRLTIHGVTRDVAVDLEARLADDRILVVGSTPFAFSDYGMTAPTAPIVLSVADDGTLEFQLFFSR